MKYSLKLTKEGLMSDTYIEKYMKNYDSMKNNSKGEYIEDYNFTTIDPYDKLPGLLVRKLNISLVCYQGSTPLILEDRNIVTKARRMMSIQEAIARTRKLEVEF